MGMTIEEARTALGKERKYALHENKQAFDIAIDVMCKYQMMQSEYENRLKADMAAMLEELQLEIEELQGKYSPYYDEASQHTSELIQQKIDALKGEKV